jgi:hypothetical protein
LEIREKAEFSPTDLARLLEQFFSDYPRAALLEDGRVLFEMAAAHYSISAEHGRCVLHLWSEEEYGAHRRGPGSAQRDTAYPGTPPGYATPAIDRGGKGS